MRRETEECKAKCLQREQTILDLTSQLDQANKELQATKNMLPASSDQTIGQDQQQTIDALQAQLQATADQRDCWEQQFVSLVSELDDTRKQLQDMQSSTADSTSTVGQT